MFIPSRIFRSTQCIYFSRAIVTIHLYLLSIKLTYLPRQKTNVKTMTSVLESCASPRQMIQEVIEAPSGSILFHMISSIENGTVHVGVSLLLQTLLSIKLDDQSYGCIFVECEHKYQHPMLMIRHLLACHVFVEGGVYSCYRCKEQHTLKRPRDTQRSDTLDQNEKDTKTEERTNAIQHHRRSLSTVSNTHNQVDAPCEQITRAIPKGRVSQIKEEEWEKWKINIYQLYIIEGLSLPNVIAAMKNRGFHATYVYHTKSKHRN